MTQHRRDFLKTSGLVALGLNVPLFVSRTGYAAPNSREAGAKQNILVLIELNGGNDGLNTVIPFKDPEYAKLRPTLAQPANQIRKLNDDLGLHPQMTALADLYQNGLVSVVQGVGYPNPDQSHFRSMDIWQAGSTAQNLTEGWVGKALKKMPSGPSFHIRSANEKSPLAFEGAPVRVPSISSLQDFQLQMAALSEADRKAQEKIIQGQSKPSSRDDLLDFVQRTASSTYASSKRLQEIGKNYQPRANYPNTPLANRLKLAAQLIDADLGARIFYVALGGFDTHSGQAPLHATLVQQLSEAVSAFWKDMQARGHKDRLLVMTFSEFGRRARENGSKGTDHGSAAPMFLIGGKIKGGVLGAHPSLSRLEDGNLKHHTDFRQVYAAVLDGWLGVSSKEVLGGTWQALDLFKA